MSLSTIPALEALIEKSLGKSDTASVSSDITMAGTMLQMVVGMLVAKVSSSVDVNGIDAAVTQILNGVTALEAAIENKPTASTDQEAIASPTV